jgi:predicted DNA-binding protein (MmcQ/YjbR family)
MAAKKKNSSTDPILKDLRAFGLAYPGAHLKSPWPGHKDLAVNDKTFAYLTVEGEPFKISCKLPHSAPDALALPFTNPTEYGLGKSGWVSARFADGDTIPVEMLREWIDESYRAQAPKKLVAQLDGGAKTGSTAKAKTASKKKVAAPKKAAPKKAKATKAAAKR